MPLPWTIRIRGNPARNARSTNFSTSSVASSTVFPITLISDGTTVYECRSPEEVVDLLQGGQGVFGIAISGAFKEIQGSLAQLPAEPVGETAAGPVPLTGGVAAAAPDEDTPAAMTDELAARRARRRAG